MPCMTKGGFFSFHKSEPCDSHACSSSTRHLMYFETCTGFIRFVNFEIKILNIKKSRNSNG